MSTDITIIRKSVKHANLKVKPTGEVILTVPLRMTQYEIDHILAKRAGWIEKHLAYFRERQLKPQMLITGEAFMYLGQSYQLNVMESEKERTQLMGTHFELYVPDTNDYQKKELLIDKWYRERAKEYFIEAIEQYQPLVKREVNRVSIKRMKTRWGSCNHTKGYINLNLELIKKPKSAIEYVVFHELVHLIYPNHSKAFYHYLSLYMPDWQERKAKLEQQG